jgi:hypothetical protein
VGGQANGGAGIAEIDADIADSCFNSPNNCGTGDDMGANPRLAASAGMTGAGVTAAEGSAYSCTDSCVGGSSEGRSVGAMASAGGGVGGSSNRTDGCGGGYGCALADLMPAMTSMLIVDRLQVSNHCGHLLDKGSQRIVYPLCGGGHGDENRVGKGGSWAAATSMVGGSEYQVVMVLDRPTVDTCLRRVRRIISYFLLVEYMPLLHLL